jgi:phospholipid/cholesterol/gamma-HCH transport system permease protein
MASRVLSSVSGLFVGAVARVGRPIVGFAEEFGRVVRIWTAGMANIFRRPFRIRLIIQQIEFIGIQSLPIILLSSMFTGAVFTLESYEAFALFGAQGMVGGTVGVALTRELSPTLTGLLVSGRAGSAMAAEIGAMRVSEQIDALEAMAVDPVNFLVKPRLIASTLALPMLTIIFDAMGVFGSWIVGIYIVHLSSAEYFLRLQDWVDWDDIWAGILKSFVFGMIIGTVACYKGFYTKGGAKGVGRATTTSVVVSSVTILITNFFLAWYVV